MPKFKKGDTITHKKDLPGLDKATISFISDEYYYVNIVCGRAILPISVEDNYELMQ